jgi:hypothetical protein
MSPNDRSTDGEHGPSTVDAANDPPTAYAEHRPSASDDESGGDTYRLLRLVKVVLAVLVSLLTIADLLGLLPA